jgi:hypothetical protein
MFTIIKSLKQEEAINLIYHLIMILNKGENDPDDAINFDEVASDLPDELYTIYDNILDGMGFRDIDDDDLLDKYIV